MEVELLAAHGTVRQYFYAEQTWWSMDATFFTARLLVAPQTEDAVWLDRDQLDQDLYHQCHAWAAAIRRFE